MLEDAFVVDWDMIRSISAEALVAVVPDAISNELTDVSESFRLGTGGGGFIDPVSEAA